ncbi:MAG: hypothetical protein EP332_13595 [Bacteroidetes bacterium]|nr:MAG: hypothetical protein EP332_13595 [Bacteroidota bacterium]
MLSPVSVLGQDVARLKELKEIPKKKPFTYGGSLSIGAGSYTTNAATPRGNPYNWFITGSPWMKFYGIQVPFSFTYSETGRSLTHPFRYQFVGVSPYYKWATLHLGYRTLKLGDYTLNGVVFKGAGVELKPGKFRFAAFYGELNPAINPDTLQGDAGVILPSYQRIAYGGKLGIGSSRNYVDFSYFRGKDMPGSLKEVPSFETIRPMDNVSFGPEFKFSFLKHFSLEGNLTLSLLTRNVLNDTLPETEELATVYRFIRVNTSTYGAYAGHIGFSMQYQRWGLGFRVKQVSSDFISLGINPIQDDLREYSMSPNFRMWKGKVSVNGTYGFYTDNLSGKRVSTTVRKIYNTSVNLAYSQRLTASIAYNNFGTTRNNGLIQMNDSIVFSIINQSWQSNVNIGLGPEKKLFFLSLFGMYQQADDQNIFTRAFNNSQIAMAGINGQYEIPSWALNCGAGLSAARFEVANRTNTTYNYQLNLRRSFWKKKLTTGLNSSLTQRFEEQLKQGLVFSSQLNVQALLAKKHRLSLSCRLMRNTTGIVSNAAFNEQRINLLYGLQF